MALEIAGVTRSEWSHPGLQAAFTAELIHRRKIYPAPFRDYLSSGLAVRQAADYGRSGVDSQSDCVCISGRGGNAAWKHVLKATVTERF